jgi:hypothetical protein
LNAANQCSPELDSTYEPLPVNPFEALRVSFGMLLGEEDFRTLMGNPRGKQMLHSSWLHGSGVVWGFPIDEADDGQLRVGVGLAYDGQGRELVLHSPKCIDVDQWVADQRRKGNLPTDIENPCADPEVTVACLVAHFDDCPTRPVPALADPCDQERTTQEASRLVERVRLELLPHDCPSVPSTGPYHRVRVLLGLDEVGSADEPGEEAREALLEVLKQPPAKVAAALLAAFREQLAWDVTAAAPLDIDDGEKNFPVAEENSFVVLARIEVGSGSVAGNPGRVSWKADITPRRGLVATSTIQELSCGLAPGLLGGRAGQDAGGPRVKRESVDWENKSTLIFKVTEPLMEGSLSRNPVTVSSLGSSGWDREDIDEIVYDGQRNVRVRLYRQPAHRIVRLIVRGTGPTPVTGTTGIPLAGMDDGPAGTIDDGHDAVVRIDRRNS